jgi:hypothetical protein
MLPQAPWPSLKMKQETPLIRPQLKTPRAAAVAGILFSILLIAELFVFEFLVLANPRETGAWLRTSSNEVALALNFVPFAGSHAYCGLSSVAFVGASTKTSTGRG